MTNTTAPERQNNPMGSDATKHDDKLTEAVARAIWECNVDEVTFDEAKAANDGKGDAAYGFNMLMAQAAVFAVMNTLKAKDAEIERLRAALEAMRIELIDKTKPNGTAVIDGGFLNKIDTALKGGA